MPKSTKMIQFKTLEINKHVSWFAGDQYVFQSYGWSLNESIDRQSRLCNDLK